MNLIVDVTSDVICPWCYIGKRRLEKAVAALGGRGDVRVRWHPFQLNPRMPKEGMNRREYRAGKFGSWERSLALDAHVTEVGRAEGIPFAFDKSERTPNTFDCHRLIWLAGQVGVQDAVVEALFRAYFTDGRDISRTPTVLDVVADAGLDRGRAEAMLSGDDGIEELREAEKRAQARGVAGVPFFLVNNEFAISGRKTLPCSLPHSTEPGSSRRMPMRAASAGSARWGALMLNENVLDLKVIVAGGSWLITRGSAARSQAIRARVCSSVWPRRLPPFCRRRGSGNPVRYPARDGCRRDRAPGCPWLPANARRRPAIFVDSPRRQSIGFARSQS